MVMKVINGMVYGADRKFHLGEVQITDGVITRVKLAPDGLPVKAEQESNEKDREDIDIAKAGEVLDARGCYVIPGLIDLHFHGAMGSDFCDGTQEAIRTIAKYEAAEGITAMCPATLTLGVQRLKRILGECAQYARTGGAWDEADLVGVNMEGPFISRAKKGAQNERYIIPCDPKLCDEFYEASGGLLKIIGLAPEENANFREYIEAVKGKVRVSLAHTNSDYETAMEAFAAGASHAVHLFNAMSSVSHRSPGVVGAVCDSRDVNAEIICDGNHVHPAMVRAAFKTNGAERMILISDSLRATGLGDGLIDLGGQEVIVQGTKATLSKSGNLAGSVTNLMDCLRIAVQKMHIPLETAVACATINPAKCLKVEDRYGCIEPGLKGNVVLLNQKDLSTAAVVKDGKLLRGRMK